MLHNAVPGTMQRHNEKERNHMEIKRNVFGSPQKKPASYLSVKKLRLHIWQPCPSRYRRTPSARRHGLSVIEM